MMNCTYTTSQNQPSSLQTANLHTASTQNINNNTNNSNLEYFQPSTTYLNTPNNRYYGVSNNMHTANNALQQQAIISNEFNERTWKPPSVTTTVTATTITTAY